MNKAGVVGDTALQGGEVSRILKRLARRAGLNPTTISGHSARLGMAQDLVAGGADLAAVMQAGRWKSPPCRPAMLSGCSPNAVPWRATTAGATDLRVLVSRTTLPTAADPLRADVSDMTEPSIHHAR